MPVRVQYQVGRIKLIESLLKKTTNKEIESDPGVAFMLTMIYIFAEKIQLKINSSIQTSTQAFPIMREVRGESIGLGGLMWTRRRKGKRMEGWQTWRWEIRAWGIGSSLIQLKLDYPNFSHWFLSLFFQTIRSHLLQVQTEQAKVFRALKEKDGLLQEALGMVKCLKDEKDVLVQEVINSTFHAWNEMKTTLLIIISKLSFA